MRNDWSLRAALMVISVVLLGLGIAITPERLIALGPFAQSLTHEVPSVKAIAEFEVAVARLGSVLLGLCALAAGLFWPRLRVSRPVRAIARRSLSATARDWRDPPLINPALILLALAFLVTFVYLVAGEHFLSPELRAWIDPREGPVEQLTALFFLLCCLCYTTLALRIGRADRRFWYYVLFAVIFAVFVGEETSWGQWIFGFETLDFFKEINVQNENNLHNLYGYMADHIYILGVFLYGAALPALCYFSPFWLRFVDLLRVPVPSLGLAAGFLVASTIHDWTVFRLFDPEVALAIPEVREFLSSLCFLVLAHEVWNQAAPKLKTAKTSAQGLQNAGWRKL